MKHPSVFLVFLPLCVFAGARTAAAFEDRAPALRDLPEIVPGFEIRLFAREPVVRNPCSLAFDRRGRMFVGMGPQYRNPTPSTPPDSVVIVQDSDGDGVGDRTHTFATGFNCIQGLAWHGRDLWVANAPDLTVVRDLDGDDVADEYVRVFTDLGNIEHGIHGLNWAPDGRLYFTKGNSKGVVVSEWKTDEPDRLAPRPFRELWGVPGPPDAPDFPEPKTFTRETYRNTYQDPRDDWGRMGGVLRCDDMGRDLEIVARGLRNPYGLAFNDSFDWLGTDQDQNEGDRLFMPFFGAHFGWSHAWSTHWTGENHLPTVPISAPVFAGSGSGVVWADAPHWPPSHRGVWIINDWLLKSTHIYRPSWDGALVRPRGGSWETLITGKDALYRPVDMAFGPDGALYILGWGRGYGVEWDKDGNMTNEGRIFRVAPRNAAPLPPPDPTPLESLSVAALIGEFSSWLAVRRIDARNELVRRGAAVLPDLLAALRSGNLPRMQETWTVWAAARCGMDDRDLVAMARPSPLHPGLHLNLQAIRILGERRSPALDDVVAAALRDPAEPRVRFAAVQAAHQAGAKSLADRLIAHAATESDRIAFYATWQALRDLVPADRLRPLLRSGQAGHRRAALLALLDSPEAQPDKEQLLALTRDPDTDVRTVASLGLGRALHDAAPAATDSASPAARLATDITAESGKPYLAGVLAKGNPSYSDRPYVFTAVPDSLDGAQMIRTANDDDGSRGRSFLTFDLPVESTVMVAHDVRLSERPEWLNAFADTDLSIATDDTRFHLWSRDFPAGRVTLGGNLAAPVRGPKANYFVVIRPAPLTPRAFPTTEPESLAALAKANPRRGEALYFLTAGCAACHRVGNRGINFGPDLTNLGDRMEARFIVQSLLDPSAVITEGFSAQVVEAGGNSYAGILLSTGSRLKLGLPGGTTVELPADTITRHESLPVSPMPPQGALLSPQDVADITAWLLSQKATAARPAAVPSPAPATAAATAASAPSTSAPSTASAAAGASVPSDLVAELRDDRIILRHGGQTVAHYVFRDPAILRPHFANLLAPDGTPVTRTHPPVEGVDATDHATMHPGVWLGFGDLNGEDFWRNKGRIEHVRFIEPPAATDEGVTFATENRLRTADGPSLGTQISRLSLSALDRGFLLVWQADFLPDGQDLVFGDQEEMGLGVRVATPLAETNGGLITSSSGEQTAKKTWGRSFEWCDYAGAVNGRRAGVTLMPDPSNFRASWFHNRDYGVMVANPFGRKAMNQGETSRVVVRPGERLSLRFGVFLHAEPAAAPEPAAPPAAPPASLTAAYRRFLERPAAAPADRGGSESSPASDAR